MAIRYVDWRNDDSFPYKNEVQTVWEGMEFYEEGDDFLVYRNDKNGKYAVYYKLYNGGELIALIEDFGTLMSMSWDGSDGF